MILFIVDARCGGAQRMTLLYAQILQKAGYDCRLLVVQRTPEKFELESFIPSSLSYDLIRGSKFDLPYRILRRIHRLRPSCLFDSFFTLTMAFVRVGSKWILPEIKVVFRESNMPSRYRRMQLAIAKKCFRYVDVIISQTEEMKREMNKYYALSNERIFVINNPIDTALIEKRIKEPFCYPFSDHIHFLAVGRVEPQKDYLTLLKAFAIVQKSLPKSHLHIVGYYFPNSRYKNEIDNAVNALNIKNKVFFEGFQDNPYKYMKAADVFVLSSIYEGLPNVMSEAMYLAIPVVATRCIPYISQVIHEGKNGFTVPIASPKELAVAMLKACSLKIYGKPADNQERNKQVVALFDKMSCLNESNISPLS